MARSQDLSQNLNDILDRIDKRAKLLAVSKRFPASDISIAAELGQVDFGENKVQELLSKENDIPSDVNIKWHLIGPLQTNKINQLMSVKRLVSIHSVDRLKLVRKLLIARPAQAIGLFLQFNTSGEVEKAGFQEVGELQQAIEMIEKSDSKFFLQGLMTMGKIRSDEFEADARACFEKLKEIKYNMEAKFNLSNLELSMGMSSDMEIALDVGTTWVRIGSTIFGERS
jgi:PLP dependent protein